MTKTVIKYYVPTNPVPQKVLEGKPQLKKVNCPHKNTGNITPTSVTKEEKHTNTTLKT